MNLHQPPGLVHQVPHTNRIIQYKLARSPGANDPQTDLATDLDSFTATWQQACALRKQPTRTREEFLQCV